MHLIIFTPRLKLKLDAAICFNLPYCLQDGRHFVSIDGGHFVSIDGGHFVSKMASIVLSRWPPFCFQGWPTLVLSAILFLVSLLDHFYFHG